MDGALTEAGERIGSFRPDLALPVAIEARAGSRREAGSFSFLDTAFQIGGLQCKRHRKLDIAAIWSHHR